MKFTNTDCVGEDWCFHDQAFQWYRQVDNQLDNQVFWQLYVHRTSIKDKITQEIHTSIKNKITQEIRK